MSIQIFAPDIKDNRVVLNPDNSIAFQQWTVDMTKHSIRKNTNWSEINTPTWEQMEVPAKAANVPKNWVKFN